MRSATKSYNLDSFDHSDESRVALNVRGYRGHLVLNARQTINLARVCVSVCIAARITVCRRSFYCSRSSRLAALLITTGVAYINNRHCCTIEPKRNSFLARMVTTCPAK